MAAYVHRVLPRSKGPIAGQGAVRENDPLSLVRRLVGELGLREMTGRGRFRAWGSYEKGRSF